MIKAIKTKLATKNKRLGLRKVNRKEKSDIKEFKDFLEELGDNEEQKKAVVSSSNRILVLAGAGSGKTKVLTKRFIHLIKNLKVPMSNVLALTFTKEATNEMSRRIAKALDLKVEQVKGNVRTFHSFALSILRQNEQFDLVVEGEQKEIIEDILYDFRNNDEIMNSIYEYIKDNLIERIKEKNNKSDKTPQLKAKPTGFGDKKIKTDSGILVRSKSERDIANFLSSLGIKWEYEKEVEWANKPFRPDFTIEGDIYLEHWAYKDNSFEIPQINKKKYLNYRKWKEEQFKKHKKVLISSEEEEMNDLLSLQLRLAKELEWIKKRLGKENEILDILAIKPIYAQAYTKFLDELIEIINLIKSLHLNIEEVEKRISNEDREKVIQFYGVLIPVFKEYAKKLKSSRFGKKDFNDLINDCIDLLRDNKSRREYYQKKIKFLLVDEYQDVSFGDVELLKLLVNKDTNFFAVGDDWQSIYGWRGSSVDYILNFERDFGVYEKIILPINYRSSKNIVLASNHFIQLSDKLHKKNIRCSKDREEDTTKIMQINADNDFSGARYVIYKVKKLMVEDSSLRPSDFLVLYRSSRTMGLYRKIFRESQFRIPQHTIHWSKGTEFKYVFVLGLKDGMYGFPNVYSDKEIKKIIMEIPVEDKEEEERRLFYVALTRAKDRVFLISERDNESIFAQQVPEEYKFILENKAK